MSQTKKQGLLASVREFAVLLSIVFLIRTFGFGLYQVPTGSMETTMLVGERFFADKFSYIFRKPRRGEIIAFNDPEYKYSRNPLVNLFQQYVWGPSNWTKRIIGIPGDHIRGTIEDGKPVLYINDVKLQEPYLNKYPLIHIWKQNFEDLRDQIESELETMFRDRVLNQSMADKVIARKLAGQTTWRSYDPSVSYEEQPFYRIKKERIITGENGEFELLEPRTPIQPRDVAIAVQTKRNHWDGSDVFYIELGLNEYWCMGDNRLGSKDCRFFGPIKGKLIHGHIVFRIWSIDSDESWWIIDLIKHPIDFWTRIRWSRFIQLVR